MLKHAEALDHTFQALSDPARRKIVSQLVRGPASVSELAKPLNMSLPAVVQHLQILERCGLISSRKRGRVRTCRLETKRLDAAQAWLDRQRSLWEARLDRMDEIILKGLDDEYS